MDCINSLRALIKRSIAALLIVSLLALPAFGLDSEDSQVFISGFNAYQKKDYQTTIDKMNQVLEKYPDTPLRDMALFWLARAYYKAGKSPEAVKYMSQFFKEYPDSPLKATVEDELLKMVAAAKGPAAPPQEKGPAKGGEKALPETAAAGAAARKAAAEKAAAEKLAAQKAAEQAAAVKLAAEKAAAEKAAAEKAAAEKAAAEKLAAEKAAAEKLAAEKAAAEKAATEKAAAEKAAAEKLAAERRATERAAAEKRVREKAAAEKALAEKAAAEKHAAQAAAEKAAAEKLAAEKVAAEKAATEKAMAEKVAAMKAAAEKAERERNLVAKVEPAPAAPAAPAKEKKKTKQSKKKRQDRNAVLREKAIAAYKSVIDRFPGSKEAARATEALRTMGIVYPAEQRAAALPPAAPTPAPRGKQVLTLEVGQFADVEFILPAPLGQQFEVGKQYKLPFEVTNRGNGTDSFALESGFPTAFDARFATADGSTVTSTPSLEPGAGFKGTLSFTVPKDLIDGQKLLQTVTVRSRFASDISQSRVVSINASAPLLRAVVKADKVVVTPGERIAYRVALLNIGSAAAGGVALDLGYPPQYEPVSYEAAGFRNEDGRLVLRDLKVASGQSREFDVTFRLKDSAVAQEELFVRADVVNTELDRRYSFLSTATFVKAVSGVSARTSFTKLPIIPGQTVSIPLTVTNTGNVRESFSVKSSVPDGIKYSFFLDINRDGIRQPNEPAITSVGPLAPHEEAHVVLELTTPPSSVDGSEAIVTVVFEAQGDKTKSAAVTSILSYGRPMVDLSMVGKGGRLKPGEVSSYDLVVVNRGTRIAKVVEVKTDLPDNLELVSTEPPFASRSNGEYTWIFGEVGPGEKRNVKVNFRVKSGISVGTSIKVGNSLTYQDQLGNRY